MWSSTRTPRPRRRHRLDHGRTRPRARAGRPEHRPDLSGVAGRGQSALPAARLPAARFQRLPVSAPAAGSLSAVSTTESCRRADPRWVRSASGTAGPRRARAVTVGESGAQVTGGPPLRPRTAKHQGIGFAAFRVLRPAWARSTRTRRSPAAGHSR
jgi:hypothetical protein